MAVLGCLPKLRKSYFYFSFQAQSLLMNKIMKNKIMVYFGAFDPV